MSIDEQDAWAAFERRDRAFDGRFVVAVSTTRIYCKPSCPARRPRRENVRFFGGGAEAQRRRLPAVPALPARGGQARFAGDRPRRRADRAVRGADRARRAGRRGRLCAAPFPAAVQARARRVAGAIFTGAPGQARRIAIEGERERDRRNLRSRLFRPEPLLRRRRRPAGHDARRRGAMAGAGTSSAM